MLCREESNQNNDNDSEDVLRNIFVFSNLAFSNETLLTGKFLCILIWEDIIEIDMIHFG